MSEQAIAQVRPQPVSVMPTSSSHGILQRCSNGVECEECRKKREATLQRAAVNTAPAHSVPPIVHDVLRSPGQSLDRGTQAFMEPRFNHDFSGVRVHTGARAAESARSVNALAYTVGRDLVFGAGQYTPTTMAGKRLLAHELTHVVQQGGRSQSGSGHLTINSPGETTEREAHNAAQFVSEGNQFGVVSQATSLQIQRLSMGEEDPIHRPIIEQYRKELGLPASGVDEFGNQVGPSDAEIKYGTSVKRVDLAVPAPPNQQLTEEKVKQITNQPLPPQKSVEETPQAEKTAAISPGQAKKPVPATPAPKAPPAPTPAPAPGVQLSLDTTMKFQLSFVGSNINAAQINRFRTGPIDLLHNPTMSMSVSLDPSKFGTLGTQISATVLNEHFLLHGKEFIELALPQLGLGFDSTGKLTGTEKVQLKIHSPNPHFSIFISSGGSVTRTKGGKWSVQYDTPIAFGMIAQW